MFTATLSKTSLGWKNSLSKTLAQMRSNSKNSLTFTPGILPLLDNSRTVTAGTGHAE